LVVVCHDVREENIQRNVTETTLKAPGRRQFQISR